MSNRVHLTLRIEGMDLRRLRATSHRRLRACRAWRPLKWATGVRERRWLWRTPA